MMELKVAKLRCEYRENPLGIDICKPRISWQIKTDRRDFQQTAYQLQVAKSDGFEDIIWDTGKVDSSQSIHVKYQGSALQARTRYFYRIKVWDQNDNSSSYSEPAFWEMGILEEKEWSALWITPDREKNIEGDDPCPLLRKTFNLRDEVKEARIYITALGLYDLKINGDRVGDYLFTPGWTSYNKRLQYQTYDVSDMLIKGQNVIGVILGNGWYKGYLGWEDQKNLYGNKLALLSQMHVTYQNGEKEIIMSDQSWKTDTGPIRMSEIYHGETYDARLEKNNWCLTGYDDSSWMRVKEIDHPLNLLLSQVNEPVKRVEEIKPVEVLETPAGEKVIDFGQNMVGRVRFKVKGEKGSEVTLKHAEVLDKEGNFYTENLRSARQEVKYILKGDEEEVFEPHFTFQGFRYVKVEGYPGEIKRDNFTGVVLHSAMEKTGDFVCSDDLINQLQHNILWGQKGNFLEVPTDCPQRDERLGWTGDAQAFIRTACFNMNVAPFFHKWLQDLKADQYQDGGVPAVIPSTLGPDSGSSSAWGDAATICPWTIYQCYGDKRILKEQYQSMKDWVEYIRKQGENEYLWQTGHHFGDWLALDAGEGDYVGATDKGYIATAFYVYSTDILIKTAKVLNKDDDVREYSQLKERVIENFRNEFVTANGRLAVPTQTAYVLALYFDLVKEKDRKRVIEDLVENIKEYDIHLTTGFVGTPYLCHVLSNNGYNDLAYKLIKQTDYPSWLYQIKKGATTIWEHWDGIKEDGSFWSADMNSFNHYAYGAIGEWLYRVVAGLDTDPAKSGYQHILIRPQPGPGLSFARASYQSMYGEIISGWKEEGRDMLVEVTIPANTTATVTLPGAKKEDVTENGEVINIDIEGLHHINQTDNGVEIKLGSGSYIFKYKK